MTPLKFNGIKRFVNKQYLSEQGGAWVIGLSYGAGQPASMSMNTIYGKEAGYIRGPFWGMRVV